MDWGTPDSVFDPLNEEFRFELDVACSIDNGKCPYGIALDAGYDSLAENWAEWIDDGQPKTCWMNPPYGREIGTWIQKAYDAKQQGLTTVCLVPARTDTQWWSIFWDHDQHTVRTFGDEVRFVKGRIKFEGAPASAPFPSAIIVLRAIVPKVWCSRCGNTVQIDDPCTKNRTCGLNNPLYDEEDTKR